MASNFLARFKSTRTTPEVQTPTSTAFSASSTYSQTSQGLSTATQISITPPPKTEASKRIANLRLLLPSPSTPLPPCESLPPTQQNLRRLREVRIAEQAHSRHVAATSSSSTTSTSTQRPTARASITSSLPSATRTPIWLSGIPATHSMHASDARCRFCGIQRGDFEQACAWRMHGCGHYYHVECLVTMLDGMYGDPETRGNVSGWSIKQGDCGKCDTVCRVASGMTKEEWGLDALVR
ncbi:hypothetical protein M011DRAFT_13164 [Sporormia fimetaria CBS 119925]|uniref:RING-type domain-containing protein n=1 Tax=Sporormia fimetaria CBS 119925 TaxID=1340428 RepID=A0A6A6VQB4_9PLEO|nr:hypothetical protein M011DRAFT_13164 [Sporormia fimetaria CBS 119925]